ncbi:MAG TPA: ACP S-malonyltransferase [Herpetosiphonaceae bacterium]
MTTAWVFPGQGSQAVGMGREVYERYASARAVFDEADTVLGFPLSRLCFEGPDDELTLTENAQPALLTTSTALLAAVREQAGSEADLQPMYLAGHSLGEYSALVASGALEFGDALRLVRRRGELMAETPQGTMAAIMGLDEETLRAVCADASVAGPVVVATENSPAQYGISGSIAGVERALALAKQHGAKRAVRLHVSVALHSPLMESAARRFAREVAAIRRITPPRWPVIANATAEPLTDSDAIRAELIEQVTAPVRWIDGVRRMVADGVTRFVEIGHGHVLSGLIKRIAPGRELIGVNTVAAIEGWIARERQG